MCEALTITQTQFIDRVEASSNPKQIGRDSTKYFALRCAFTPAKRLRSVSITVSYVSSSTPENTTFRYKQQSSCPSNGSTSGTSFTFSSKTATVTVTGDFAAGTTYYVWFWSSGGVGLVYYLTVTGTGELAGLVHVDTGTGWADYEVYVDTGSAWVRYLPYVDNGASWDLMA